MKPRTIVFLLGLLILCILYVGIRYVGRDVEPVAAPVTGKVFPGFDGEAQKLEITSPEGRRRVFEKTEDRWRIVEPLRAEAQSYAVNRIVDQFRWLEYVQVIDPEQDDVSPELTGLQRPRWTVTLTDREGERYVLEVGSELPAIGAASPSAYVRAQDTTYRVEAQFADLLGRPLREYRSKEILDLEQDRISRVSIIAARNFTLEKADGVWQLTAPVSARANQQRVKDLVSDVARLSARSFVDDEAASLVPYGLDQPAVVVSLEVGPEQPETAPSPETDTQPATEPAPVRVHTLALGRKADNGSKVFARLDESPSVFTLRGSLVEDLQPELIDLRERKLFDFDPQRVIGVELAARGERVALAKEQGAWSVTSAPEGAAGEQKVREFLDDLLALSAEDFADAAGPPVSVGLAEPTARIDLQLADEGRSVGLLVGARTPSGDMVFARATDQTAVAVLHADAVEKLLVDPDEFRDPTLLSLEADERVQTLSVRCPGRPAVRVARKPDGQWRLVEPVDAPADAGHVDSVLDRLTELTATRVVHAGQTLPERYASARTVVVELETSTRSESQAEPTTVPAEEAETVPATAPTTEPSRQPGRTIRLNVARVEDDAYGWLTGGEIVTVGQFDAALHDDLCAEMRSRELWNFTPARIAEVRIRRAEQEPTELIREAEEWRWPGGPYVRIDASKVRDFLRDLNDLAASRFVVHEQPSDPDRFGLDEPWLEIELVAPETTRALRVGSEAPGENGSRYAAVDELSGVFLLSAADLDKLARQPGDFRRE